MTRAFALRQRCAASGREASFANCPKSPSPLPMPAHAKCVTFNHGPVGTLHNAEGALDIAGRHDVAT